MDRPASFSKCAGEVVKGRIKAPFWKGGVAGAKGPERVLCHEHHRSKRRCGTVREMKEGPSRPAVRCRSQATASCCRQERWWCCVKNASPPIDEFRRVRRTAVPDQWTKTRLTNVAIAAPLAKRADRNPREFFALRYFRDLRHDQLNAVLDHREIGPRLIRLTQRQIVFRGRPSQASHRVTACSRHSRCPMRFSSASTPSLSRS